MTTPAVLIVEDDANLREALFDTLNSDDLPVLTADDGTAALDILQRESIGLVVTDWQMAPMDGMTLLGHLREDYPNLPAEFNQEPHVRGVCSMARSSAPNSANSQFFICFDDATFLDGQYTAWGKVTEGMAHVDQIKRGEPVADPDKIVSMQVAADAG